MISPYNLYGLEEEQVLGYYEDRYFEDLGGWIFNKKCIETGKIIRVLHPNKLREVNLKY